MLLLITVLVGTGLIWLPRLNGAEGALWPTVLATAGLWLLGFFLFLLRHRRPVK